MIVQRSARRPNRSITLCLNKIIASGRDDAKEACGRVCFRTVRLSPENEISDRLMIAIDRREGTTVSFRQSSTLEVKANDGGVAQIPGPYHLL